MGTSQIDRLTRFFDGTIADDLDLTATSGTPLRPHWSRLRASRRGDAAHQRGLQRSQAGPHFCGRGLVNSVVEERRSGAGTLPRRFLWAIWGMRRRLA